MVHFRNDEDILKQICEQLGLEYGGTLEEKMDIEPPGESTELDPTIIYDPTTVLTSTKYPVSKKIAELYMSCWTQDETQRQPIRDEIVGLVKTLKASYLTYQRARQAPERDWVTLEVFPGAEKRFGQHIGTPKEFDYVATAPHYLARMMQIEDFLRGKTL